MNKQKKIFELSRRESLGTVHTHTHTLTTSLSDFIFDSRNNKIQNNFNSRKNNSGVTLIALIIIIIVLLILAGITMSALLRR